MFALLQSLPSRPGTATDDGARISPTTHYTGEVWVRPGLSDQALSTPLGAVLHAALLSFDDLYGRLPGRPHLDAMLQGEGPYAVRVLAATTAAP